MKDKLIGLIKESVGGCATYWASLIADHLIANGVTIGKEDNVVIKRIDLVGKCGSCRYFNVIESTANGECLKSPYGDDVVHDPKHPYRIVPRSKIRCVNYLMRTPEPPKGES